MNCFIQVDDFGLTRGITDDILDCCDNGVVHGASIVPNGHAYEYAVAESRKRPNLEIAVHINLVEGKPVSTESSIAPLLNENGEFHLSFQSLWLAYVTGGSRKRRALKEAARSELAAQIARVISSIGGDRPVHINSHRHCHMIPFVSEALLELAGQIDITYCRTLHEPFFLNAKKLRDIANYAGPNVIKHVLLNRLSRKIEPKLSEAGVGHCRYFVGLLFAGRMTEDVVRAALARLPRLGENDSVEILFHPGRANRGEEHVWAIRPGFAAYTSSPWRTTERETLKAPGFRDLIESTRTTQ